MQSVGNDADVLKEAPKSNEWRSNESTHFFAVIAILLCWVRPTPRHPQKTGGPHLRRRPRLW
jgi:hypothetical protein